MNTTCVNHPKVHILIHIHKALRCTEWKMRLEEAHSKKELLTRTGKRIKHLHCTIADLHIKIPVLRLRRELIADRLLTCLVLSKHIFIRLGVMMKFRFLRPGKSIQGVLIPMEGLSYAGSMITGRLEGLRKGHHIAILLPYPCIQLCHAIFFRTKACKNRSP